MNNEEAKQLLLKYNAGQCTPSEKALLEDWFLQFNENEINIPPQKIEELGRQIYAELSNSTLKKRKVLKFCASVTSAAAIFLLTIGTWYFSNKPQSKHKVAIVQDVLPGGNKAILTLEDGRKVKLNSTEGGVSINGDEISYLSGKMIETRNNKTNEGVRVINTPRGGQYYIILSDGTKVWLNAASSMHFPISFEGKKERRVILSGEAYFEVEKIKGAKIPFIVVTGDGRKKQELEVLGTHFNINTYNLSRTQTTLLEGSVKLSAANGNSVKLKPGYQSIFSDQKFEIGKVDTDLEIAWKNGKIAFESADIQTVMMLLKLWYDIDITYIGEITNARFSGSVSRSKNISEVLKLLESTNEVHFKIKGREIIVMN